MLAAGGSLCHASNQVRESTSQGGVATKYRAEQCRHSKAVHVHVRPACNVAADCTAPRSCIDVLGAIAITLARAGTSTASDPVGNECDGGSRVGS